MTQKRKPISEGATVEQLQDRLLDLARQLRAMAPFPRMVIEMDQVIAKMTEMKKQSKSTPALV